MGASASTEEKDVIAAVTDYVYYRHSGLAPSNIVGFTPDELERIKTEDDNLVFTVEDVKIVEKPIDDGITVYYVSATLQFQTDDKPIEGSTGIYQCYRCGDKWCIEWHSC